MRGLDFTSWQTLLSTLFGLAVITLIGVGIRLIVMQTIQQRRERENRQINERLRTLIAAYKTLGGSFTGNLAVDPSHLRDLRRRTAADPEPADDEATWASSDRSRRIRDAVEAALSDIILLGTEEQVQLAARAAGELAAGRPAHTDELVISLRNFIRQVLDLEAVPGSVVIPKQGPARPSAGGGKGGGNKGEGDRERQGGGGKNAGGGAAGAGMGMGVGMGLGAGTSHTEEEETDAHR
jgi:uncharacterized membrane protein YgcG